MKIWEENLSVSIGEGIVLMERDVLAGELLLEAHLRPAAYEDKGEGLGGKLVVRVDGDSVPDDLHQILSRRRACNNHLLDGVGGVEGMPRSENTAFPAIACRRVPVVAYEDLSCGGGGEAQVEVVDDHRAWVAG
jgi:hypothetical protein